LNSKGSTQKYSLVMIADGFVETEAIGMLCALRAADLCTKNVGLTNGMINGVHGVPIMPDLTLADLERAINIQAINLVVLPGGERHLASLEADPRVHRLLHQVVAQQGLIITDASGAPWVIEAIRQDQDERNHGSNALLVVRHPFEQSIEAFAQDVMRRIERKLPT
jgi:putative intracellular protease/amidase